MSRGGFTRVASAWAKSFRRQLRAASRVAAPLPAAKKATASLRPARKARAAPVGAGVWLPGVAVGATGVRRYRLYRPPGLKAGERLPLLVMLHGCDQDSAGFAASTRMNTLARRERFLVLYPEQDRLANAQRCWNWYDTRNGRAHAEAALILAAIDQVALLQPVDPERMALVGLSAGASMAALLATRQPQRFRAVVMHSGIAPGAAESTATALAAMRGRHLPAPPERAPGDAPSPWPALLVIQGGRDSMVSPSNGPAVAQLWAAHLGAATTATRTVQRGQRHAMTVTDFQRQGLTRVTLVDVPRLAHAWSGGAASQPYSDAQGPDASRMAWAFALRQFRQTAKPEPT